MAGVDFQSGPLRILLSLLHLYAPHQVHLPTPFFSLCFPSQSSIPPVWSFCPLLWLRTIQDLTIAWRSRSLFIHDIFTFMKNVICQLLLLRGPGPTLLPLNTLMLHLRSPELFPVPPYMYVCVFNKTYITWNVFQDTIVSHSLSDRNTIQWIVILYILSYLCFVKIKFYK